MRDEGGYELVMPFVSCISQGGPYEDEAFVAGFQVGGVDALLAAGMTPPPGQPYYRSLLPQLDLVAMRHGRTVTVEGCGPREDEPLMASSSASDHEWVNLTFSGPRR